MISFVCGITFCHHHFTGHSSLQFPTVKRQQTSQETLRVHVVLQMHGGAIIVCKTNTSRITPAPAHHCSTVSPRPAPVGSLPDKGKVDFACIAAFTVRLTSVIHHFIWNMPTRRSVHPFEAEPRLPPLPSGPLCDPGENSIVI